MHVFDFSSTPRSVPAMIGGFQRAELPPPPLVVAPVYSFTLRTNAAAVCVVEAGAFSNVPAVFILLC